MALKRRHTNGGILCGAFANEVEYIGSSPNPSKTISTRLFSLSRLTVSSSFSHDTLLSSNSELEDMARGVIPDKWSMRILWGCAIGSAIGLYMVAVERQMQNRAKMLAEAMEAESREAE